MRIKKNKKKHLVIRVLVIILCVLSAGMSVAVIAGGIYLQKHYEARLPDSFLQLAEGEEAPRFFAYRFSDRANRQGISDELETGLSVGKTSGYLAYPDLPKNLIHAFVSIEDKHFFEHRGVDWRRTLAATANYALGFSGRFGASTITQQLVKNLTGNSDISAARKIQEIFYACELERRLDKTEIMELYLNIICFADQCDGITAAAEHYFSKSPSELTLAECATIAAITNNPSYYNPIRHPENNLKRRNLILGEMHEDGYITESEYRSALDEGLQLSVSERGEGGNGINSWYIDMVIEDVTHDLCEAYGISRSLASHYLYTGGLRIDTAMDREIQDKVEEYYRTAIQLPKNANGVSAQSALIVIDPRTGDILGVAGAVGEKQGNRVQSFATQTKRPPGSAIKPITVYAPALEKGIITWSSVLDDVPVNFYGNVAWPRNSSNVYRGLTNIPYAVAHSTNTVAVRILAQIGLEEAYRTASENYHLSGLISRSGANDCDYAALALGQLNYGVTLRELTAAYTVFADGGVYHPYRSYYRVLDREGNILLSRADAAEPVLSQANAAIMTKLLQGVVTDGTSSSITLADTVECAGKTGTTNANGDRWFIGYTPDLICGVWCGYEYPEPLTGRNYCLDIWNRVMGELVDLGGGAGKAFPIPSDLIRVSYCKDSGSLPSEACAHDPRGGRTEIGWFVRGTEPTAFCECHVLCEYDSVCGGISHGNCPSEHLTQTALIRLPRRVFPVEVLVKDAQYAYGGDPHAFSPNERSTQPYFGEGEGFCGISPVTNPYHRSCCEHALPPDTGWSYLTPRFFEDSEE